MITFSLILLLQTGFVGYPVKASPETLDIQIATDKQLYNVGEPINVFANITLDGNPRADLAAVEIDDPNGDLYVIRTVETGDVSNRSWFMQILDLYTCDSHGNPQTVFSPGVFAYVNLTIKNTQPVNTFHVKAALYMQSSSNTPLLAFYPFEIDIGAGQVIQNLAAFPIPSDALRGEARVFASLFTAPPTLKDMGYAYCPEKTATFYIQTATPPMPSQPQYFNITFTLPWKGAKLGNYTIYATTHYIVQTPIRIKQFTVTLIGDIVKDGVINMRDITACILLFRTTPASPNWNPDADVNKDGIVDMRDITFLILSFQKTAIY